MSSIFKKGGPLNIVQTGTNEYTATVAIPGDAEGRRARECPNTDCSPGYFKVRGGTGITENQSVAYCPYCRQEDEPSAYATKEQVRYAKDLLVEHAVDGFRGKLSQALGLDHQGTRQLGGRLFSINLSLERGHRSPVRRPYEEQIRRDIVCPHCGLDHSVYGLATWCADCGADIFLVHVDAELAVVKAMLDDIPRREKLLGVRVSGKDLENCLEDVVSIFEAVLRFLVRRCLAGRGTLAEDIENTFKKDVRNGFQSVRRCTELLETLLGLRLATVVDDLDVLGRIFEKRHPIVHNLGVVDRKYLQSTQAAEAEGTEVSVSTSEILQAMELASRVFRAVHALV